MGKFLTSSGAEGGEGAPAPPTEQTAIAEPKTAEQEAAEFIERANESELKDYIDGSKTGTTPHARARSTARARAFVHCRLTSDVVVTLTAVLPTYFVDEVVNPQEPQTWGNVTRLGTRDLPFFFFFFVFQGTDVSKHLHTVLTDPLIQSISTTAGFGNVEVCGLNVAYYTLPRPSPASGTLPQQLRLLTGACVVGRPLLTSSGLLGSLLI